MSTKLHAELEKIRATSEQLERIERRLVRTCGRLAGGPGNEALREAVANLTGSRAALGQAEEELEIEDGSLLGIDG